MMTSRVSHGWFTTLFCLLVPMTATAGEVVKDDPLRGEDSIGIVTAGSESSFRHHARALARWLLASQWDASVSRRDFDPMVAPYLRGTFLRARYTWTDPQGHMQSRFYFSASGAPEPLIPSGMHPSNRFAAFVAGSSVAFHAELREDDESRIRETPVDGDRRPDQRRNDAELKAVRTIERQIRREDNVMRGGELHLNISNVMCDSCERAVKQFADAYDVEVHVHTLSSDTESPLRKSFKRKRKDFMDDLYCELTSRWQPPGPSSTPPSSGGGGGATCNVLRVY